MDAEGAEQEGQEGEQQQQEQQEQRVAGEQAEEQEEHSTRPWVAVAALQASRSHRLFLTLRADKWQLQLLRQECKWNYKFNSMWRLGACVLCCAPHNRHWGFALAWRALANKNARSRQQSEGAGGCVAVMSFAVGRHNNNGFIYKPSYKPS